MKTGISVYNKISSDLDIKIEPFDVKKRYTKPHHHNKYLELVYFIEGSGFHYIDGEAYTIAPPLIFVIKNGQVHHWAIATEPKGFVIIVKEEFLYKTSDRHINQQLWQLEAHSAFGVAKDGTIDALFEIISGTLGEDFPDPHTIEGLLKALLARILHNAPTKDYMEKDLAHNFRQLLKDGPKNNVAHYAHLLHTTSQNLNAQCRKKFGKTASQIIGQHIVQETKRLLIYTQLSINEIAYASNFKDTSYFVKYFKRFEGTTPMQFRKDIIR